MKMNEADIFAPATDCLFLGVVLEIAIIFSIKRKESQCLKHRLI